MRQTATAYYDSATFQDAAACFAKAWRKQHGNPVPVLSHVLSRHDNDTWQLVCAETGETLATVVDGMAAIIAEVD
jgi:hypothetical protein